MKDVTAAVPTVRLGAWTLGYLVVGVGLAQIQLDPGQASWYPPIAIGVAMLWAVGWRWWPLVLAAELVVSYVQFDAWDAMLAAAGVTTLEVVCVVALLGLTSFSRTFDVIDDVVALVVVVVVVTAVGGVVGAGLVEVVGFDDGTVPDAWRLWFVGGLSGLLGLLPLLFLASGGRMRARLGGLSSARLAELAALVVVGVALVAVTFHGIGRSDAGFSERLPLVLALVPVLWVAVRFGRLRTVLYTVVLNVTALVAFGLGADGRVVSEEGMVSMELFVAVVSLAGLMVAVAVHSERAARFLEGAMLEASPVAIIVLDLQRRVLVWNRASERIFGWPAADVLGGPPPMIADDDREHFEARAAAQLAGPTETTLRYRHREGAPVEARLTTAPMRDGNGNVIGVVGVIEDVTERASLAAELAREQSDRRAVTRAVAAIVPHATIEASAQAVCHGVGSLEGVDWAAVLRRLPDGRVVTLGALLPATASMVQAPLAPEVSEALWTLTDAGSWVVPWDETSEQPGPGVEALRTVGSTALGGTPLVADGRAVATVVVGTTHPDGVAFLEARMGVVAEVAVHAGVVLGGQFSELDDQEATRERIGAVIAAHRFHPVFQPIVDLDGGDVVGYEALTRFHDGTRPDLAFAEAHAVDMGFELEEACLGAALVEAGRLPEGVWVSLNVSPALVLAGRVVPLVRGQHRPVVLEVTEHDEVADYAALRRALQSVPGVRVSVDDAGAGYASLRHVVELEPDLVKLDIGLVRAIEKDPARQAMVAGMHHFAAETGTELLAEGVETEQEAETLRALGVTLAQGYLFGRPGRVSEIDGVAEAPTAS